MKKVNESCDEDKPAIKMIANYFHRLVFPSKLEGMLTEYLIERSKILSGISAFELRKMAVALAEKNNLNIPNSWKKNKLAGKSSRCSKKTVFIDHSN